MESESYLMAIKTALIESIMAETDIDLLDLIGKILNAEGVGSCQRLQTLQTG